MTNVRKIVVDTETTGLDPLKHMPWEVAWYDADQDFVSGVLYPSHDLREADGQALKIGGYYDRIENYPLSLHQDIVKFHQMLSKCLLIGANVRFDAQMLNVMFKSYGLYPEPWHHRLFDIQVYGAAVLGLKDDIPGLGTLARMLGIYTSMASKHTADYDAWLTKKIYKRLMEIDVTVTGVRIGK